MQEKLNRLGPKRSKWLPVGLALLCQGFRPSAYSVKLLMASVLGYALMLAMALQVAGVAISRGDRERKGRVR